MKKILKNIKSNQKLDSCILKVSRLKYQVTENLLSSNKEVSHVFTRKFTKGF